MRNTKNSGFTIVELMIVVAIILILVAIAIPNFLRFQLRSKMGEARTNIAGIRTAQESYYAEFGEYLQVAPWPAGWASGKKRVWDSVHETPFDLLNWAPRGDVYFTYRVTVSSDAQAFIVLAEGDVDEDGQKSNFAYVSSGEAGVSLAEHFGENFDFGDGCLASGVFNAATGERDLLSSVRRCMSPDGETEF